SGMVTVSGMFAVSGGWFSCDVFRRVVSGPAMVLDRGLSPVSGKSWSVPVFSLDELEMRRHPLACEPARHGAEAHAQRGAHAAAAGGTAGVERGDFARQALGDVALGVVHRDPQAHVGRGACRR